MLFACPLQGALGLNNSDLSLAGLWPPQCPDLPIAVLAARDEYIFGIDFFAESRQLIYPDLIAASHHRSTAFEFRRHLGVGNDFAVDLFDEAEIGRPVILMIVRPLVSTAARPHGDRENRHHHKRHSRHNTQPPEFKLHSDSPLLGPIPVWLKLHFNE